MKKDFLILKYEEEKGCAEYQDTIAVEKAFTVAVNGLELITLMCSPVNFEELALGFLLSEGILNWDVEVKVELDEKCGLANVLVPSINKLNLSSLGKRTLTSGCGKGAVFYNLNDHRDRRKVSDDTKFELRYLQEIMSELQKRSRCFFETGGVHSAGLVYNGDLVLREDIGRHNAVDKLLGYCFVSMLTPSGLALFLSGRISSEIVLKSARIGFPLIVSRSAPTSLAIELADELGITLAGFVRGKRANIYSHKWRIDL